MPRTSLPCARREATHLMIQEVHDAGEGVRPQQTAVAQETERLLHAVELLDIKDNKQNTDSEEQVQEENEPGKEECYRKTRARETATFSSSRQHPDN